MTTQPETALIAVPWYRKLGIVLAWIPVIPLMPFAILAGMCIVLILGLSASICNVFSERNFRWRMRIKGRFLPPRQLESGLTAAEHGTLILEFPSPGWAFTRAWWTPDDTPSLAPTPAPNEVDSQPAEEPDRSEAWNQWHWDNYLSPEQGTAFLIRVWNGASVVRRLKRRFETVNAVVVSSFFVASHQEDVRNSPLPPLEQESGFELWLQQLALGCWGGALALLINFHPWGSFSYSAIFSALCLISAWSVFLITESKTLGWSLFSIGWLFALMDGIGRLSGVFMIISPQSYAVSRSELALAYFPSLALPALLSIPALYFAYKCSAEKSPEGFGWIMLAPLIGLYDATLVACCMLLLRDNLWY